jgi:hypothetical protein
VNPVYARLTIYLLNKKQMLPFAPILSLAKRKSWIWWIAILLFLPLSNGMTQEDAGRERHTAEDKLSELERNSERLLAKLNALEGKPVAPAPVVPLNATKEIIHEDTMHPAIRKVLEASAEEDRMGNYILPFIAMVFPDDVRYASTTESSEIESNMGYQFGIAYGKRWGNWTGDLSLSFARNGYETLVHSDSRAIRIPVPGESELFEIGCSFGYIKRLGFDGWIHSGVGLGWGMRKDAPILHFPTGLIRPPEESKSSLLTYEVFSGFGYALSDSTHARLTYRLKRLGENGKYGPLWNHFLEFGIGSDF